MEVKEIEHGVHPDGMNWRVRKIGKWYYYSEQIYIRYGLSGRWLWQTNFINDDLTKVLERVKRDTQLKQDYIDFMKERSSNG